MVAFSLLLACRKKGDLIGFVSRFMLPERCGVVRVFDSARLSGDKS